METYCSPAPTQTHPLMYNTHVHSSLMQKHTHTAVIEDESLTTAEDTDSVDSFSRFNTGRYGNTFFFFLMVFNGSFTD